MNKKGVKLLDVLIAFIISIILVIVIFRVMGFISPWGEKEESTINSFDKLVDNIDNLKNNEDTNSLFSLSKKYALVGFKKDLDYIGTGSYVDCDDFRIKKINKPDEFKDKGALCLCDKELLDKEDENVCEISGICVPFSYDIIDSKNECGIFLLLGESTNNLKIERRDNVIDIHKS